MNRSRPTSAAVVLVLVAIGLVAGRLVPPVLVRLDGSVPRVSWAPAVTLLLVSAPVLGLAWSTWQSLHKRRERMTSDHGVRMLAIAKSTALVGALVGGLYGGFALTFVDALDTPLGRERVLHAGAAALASWILMTAGLLLERACRVPPDDEETDLRDADPA